VRSPKAPAGRLVALAAADIELAATLLNKTSEELQAIRRRLDKAARLVGSVKSRAK
jgi:hypothetical protein